MKQIIFGCLLVLFASCDTTSSLPSAAPYEAANDPGIMERSLFNDPQSTISEADIQRLLSGELRIPDTVRLAIFNYVTQSRSSYYYSYWNDEEAIKTQQVYLDTLQHAISAAARVQRMINVPSILANTESSITNLREVAVRLQADMLFIYTVKSDLYYKYKVFSADEAKAFATCEAFLMETRTGLIPFTTVVTREHFIRKKDADLTVEEMRKRAVQEAVIKALSEVGVQVVEFFEAQD